MEQGNHEHLAQNTALTSNDPLGSTPKSMSRDFLRSRCLLPLSEENGQSSISQINRPQALPRSQYASTVKLNAQLAALDEGLKEYEERDTDNGNESAGKHSSYVSGGRNMGQRQWCIGI